MCAYNREAEEGYFACSVCQFENFKRFRYCALCGEKIRTTITDAPQSAQARLTSRQGRARYALQTFGVEATLCTVCFGDRLSGGVGLPVDGERSGSVKSTLKDRLSGTKAVLLVEKTKGAQMSQRFRVWL